MIIKNRPAAASSTSGVPLYFLLTHDPDGRRWIIDIRWSDQSLWAFWSEFKTKREALQHCAAVSPSIPVVV